MTAMTSQITNLTTVYLIFYSGADQGKHQSSASLAIVRGNHRWPVNSPHKGPVTRKMFPFDNVIINVRIVYPIKHGTPSTQSYQTLSLLPNRACHPGGHCWDYYWNTISLRKVTATHLKIGHLHISLSGNLIFKWFAEARVHNYSCQESIPSNVFRATCFIGPMMQRPLSGCQINTNVIRIYRCSMTLQICVQLQSLSSC